MATLAASEFTYTSGVSPMQWRFTVSVDAADNLSVRNIISPTGLICDSVTSVPSSVLDDINTARSQVENILATTSTVNGTLVYADETSQSVVFTTPLADTSYRIQITPPDTVFINFRISAKTTTGFTVTTSADFTGSVGYDVFV